MLNDSASIVQRVGITVMPLGKVGASDFYFFSLNKPN